MNFHAFSDWIFFARNLLLCALIVGCVDVNSLPAQSGSDYFPMHIGNKWLYKLTTGYVGRHYANQVITITDTTLIKQKKYFVFDDKIYDFYYQPGRVNHSTHYYRKSDNGDVMMFNKLLDEEQLYYTFLRDSLYKPYFYSDDVDSLLKWKITFLDAGTISGKPFGVPTNFYDYSFGIWKNGRVGLTIWKTLAANIGLFSVAGEGDANFLIGAYINGKLLGDTLLTSVDGIAQTNVPRYPTLRSNYPNPFHNTTHIPYYVPEFWKAPIRVTVFDINGREITTLIQEKHITGSHEILWNGKNKNGYEVCSGIYLVRLTSGQFTTTIKMNYLR